MVVMKVTSQVLNTVHVGGAFFALFSADFTITGLQKLINVSIGEDNPDYHVDGYVSLGLIYLFFGIFLLTGPSIISFCGPRTAMVIGSFMMTMFFFLFYFENTWLTYLGIFFTGSGGSILWVGQGNYIILNSETETVPMHVALFWAIFSTSMAIGNVYTAVAFAGKTRVDRSTRQHLILTSTAVGIVSVVMLLFLRPPKGKRDSQHVPDTPAVALKRTFSLYFSREFLILLMTFASIGFQQSFGWGVYASSIGFTKAFGTFATQLAPISAIAYGVGDSLGASIHIFAPKMGYFWTRRYVFWIGYILQVLAFVGIYVNIPDQAVFGYTDATSYIAPQAWLAILCSVALGVSDGFYNTQVYPVLAHMHPEYGAQTSALYKFTKSMSVAAFFFASTVFSLREQLVIMIVMGFIGSICFSIVDKRVHKMTEDRINNLPNVTR